MKLYLSNNKFHYELENIARLFFWQLTVEPQLPDSAADTEDRLAAYCEAGEDGELRLFVSSRLDGKTLSSTDYIESGDEDEAEHRLAVMLFSQLCELTGKRPPFGVMTGVRPAKYTASLIESGMTADEAERELIEHELVSADKARLCRLNAETGIRLGRDKLENGYSLYISVPFCPSRCSYCSFVSKSVEKEKKLIEPYLQHLLREIEHVADITKDMDLTLQTIYIGGGTPTVFSAEQLKAVTDTVARCLPKPQLGEYSVEAGRPDTITEEKLRVLKDAGVTRISINPQTANDAVLAAVGRRHTAKDIERCYEMARSLGFNNINADLIAGLPGDDLESFKHSVDWCMNTLKAENVTVHALTLKRASTLRESVSDLFAPDAADMVSHAFSVLTDAGYLPYYMYRQKGTVESLENTGYAKPGFECYYNLFIMDELQSIIACGAGAVTKLKNPKTGVIERVFDLKYPQEYMQRFDEMLQRKNYIKEFYQK